MKRLLFFILTVFTFSLRAQLDSTEMVSAYDFWVGEWEATWDEGDGKKGKGLNSLTKELDGKVIQENFRITEGQSKGFKGRSLSVYQPNLNRWK